MQARSVSQGRTHRLAVGLALLTVILLASGGLVTSHNAGLAVPDWPNSYGYNMFLFPVERWVGAIGIEHAHRLVASVIGMVTIVLVCVAWPAGGRLRRVAIAALILVIVQGCLGGLRVVLLADAIGILHALLANVFLALVAGIALISSRWWAQPLLPGVRANVPAGWTGQLIAAAALMVGQLLLGAAMRHAHAGLSIPDFPTAYGQWWPPLDPTSVDSINQVRSNAGEMPTSASQIVLQFAHRIGGIFVLAIAVNAWLRARNFSSMPTALRRVGGFWLLLIFLQLVLGIWTITSGKAADIATVHMALGACALTCTVLLAMASRRIEILSAGRGTA